jgi:hypothetical protein
VHDLVGGEEEGECEHVGRHDAKVDAGAVRGGGDDAGEGLVGDGAEVAHGEAVGGERGVQVGEGDAGLGDDVARGGVDLVSLVRVQH